jgi:hypothetical protein
MSTPRSSSSLLRHSAERRGGGARPGPGAPRDPLGGPGKPPPPGPRGGLGVTPAPPPKPQSRARWGGTNTPRRARAPIV